MVLRHQNRTGSISLATIVAILLLAFLLGMVINVAHQIDSKIKMQNAADAATYSGGLVLARGMNAVAFSNNLLCEVFAMTAVMREARDRHGEPLVPEILAAWDSMAPDLARAPTLPDWPYPKLSAAGNAIPQKTPLEQEMVTKYGEWMAASSELVLPLLEEILQQEMIPQFTRDVVQATPSMAQVATARIAEQHTGRSLPWDQGRPQIEGILWRTIVDPVGGASEAGQGTLPIVDPSDPQFADYFNAAIGARNNFASNYLRRWNAALMDRFDGRYYGHIGLAKMSAFGGLWDGFTCGQLQQLISEYPDRNLPHMIRREAEPSLMQNYMFVGVAYRQKVFASVSRVFWDTLQADNQTFAQGMLFVPRSRPVEWPWQDVQGNWHYDSYRHGEFWSNGVWGPPSPSWDLWNQGWTFQLVPATAPAVPSILMQPPQSSYIANTTSQLQLPNLSNVSSMDILRLTTH